MNDNSLGIKLMFMVIIICMLLHIAFFKYEIIEVSGIQTSFDEINIIKIFESIKQHIKQRIALMINIF